MSKGLEAITSPISSELRSGKQYYTYTKEDVETIEKELKALNILIKWYQPDIIHDLCCFGASDEEIALVKEILNEHR